MSVKVYVSGICGSQEVRKQQQRVLFVLGGTVPVQVVDVTAAGGDADLAFMQEAAKAHGKTTHLPPQIFNGDQYCGDYTDFELANDEDRIMSFLKLEEAPISETKNITSQDTETKNSNEVEDIPIINDNEINSKEEAKPDDEGLVISDEENALVTSETEMKESSDEVGEETE